MTEPLRTVEDLIKALSKLPPKATFTVSCHDGADTVYVSSEEDYDGFDRVWIVG